MMAYKTQEMTVLAFLKSGKTLTRKQGEKMLRIENISKPIYELRIQGYDIVSKNNTRTGRGRPTVTYRLKNAAVTA
jgi:predicted transcriptional regulator